MTVVLVVGTVVVTTMVVVDEDPLVELVVPVDCEEVLVVVGTVGVLVVNPVVVVLVNEVEVEVEVEVLLVLVVEPVVNVVLLVD